MVTDLMLMQAIQGHGLVMKDVRAILAKHPTRIYAHRDTADLRGVVVHQALTLGYGQRAIEAIARYHVSDRSHLKDGGAPGFAYTMAIDGDGTLYLTQPLTATTWSHGQRKVPDANTALIGVCLLGRYSYTDSAGRLVQHDTPPPPQEAALAGLWRVCESLWHWTSPGPDGGLLSHRDLGKGSCPGDRLVAVQQAIRAGLPIPSPVSALDLSGESRVKYQQACLASLSYPLGPGWIDGVEGNATKAAIATFQHDHDLEADGIWGPITDAKMRQVMVMKYPPKYRPVIA